MKKNYCKPEAKIQIYGVTDIIMESFVYEDSNDIVGDDPYGEIFY